MVVWAQAAALLVLIASMVMFTVPVHALQSRIIQLSQLNNAASGMQQALIDQETGQRGFDLTANPVFLEPFVKGTHMFETHRIAASRLVLGFPEIAHEMKRAIGLAETWHRQDGVPQIRMMQQGLPVRTASLLQGKARMDAFRTAIAHVTNWTNDQVIQDSSQLQRLTVETAICHVLIACLSMCLVTSILVSRFRQWALPIAKVAHQVQQYADGDLSDPIRAAHTETSLNVLFYGIERMRQGLAHQLVRLENESLLDGLTGIGNRRYFDRELFLSLERSAEVGMEFALCMLDIDHFKQFNDRYGHLEGDRMLCTVAEALARGALPEGKVARFGGEEFAWIATGRLTHIVNQVDALRAAIERETGVTLSVGVAMAQSTDSAESLLNRADQALYVAKSEGRNRVRVAAS